MADGVRAGTDESRSKVASETKLIKQPTWVFVEKESEILRADLLEKLNRCKRDTLIELCRSFNIIGSRANRKEELASFLMDFVMDHCSGIDGTYSDKKMKKRRRMKEEESLSSGKPSKKKKQEGEEEAEGRNGLEDRAKYYDCDLMDTRYIFNYNNKGKIPNEETNLAPSERINGCVSENFDGISLSEVPIPTDEQAMIATPYKKLVATADGGSNDVKAFKNKKSLIAQKKGTPNKENRKVKSCGKQESKGDTQPQKQAMKPSKDELRKAVFLILDTANFATMTFGDVVKEVDKYFGMDLFERKPLIRSLIEEELFRLTEEAEKKELEEEELAEAKARAEQAAKEMAQVRTTESDIDRRGVNGGASVESAVKRNSSDAAEGSQDHKTDAGTPNENIRDGLTKDGNGEEATPIANGNSVIQVPNNGGVQTMKNSTVQTLENSKDGKVEGASNGENNDTESSRNEEGRGGNVGSNAEVVNGCQVEESNYHGNDDHAEHTEDGKAREAHNNGNSTNVEIHGDKDGKAKVRINAEQSQVDAGGNGKAEDDEHNTNTKVDVDSGKNAAAENAKTDNGVKGNSDGAAIGSPM
nr:unnamed protein product [Digitaria exilis]